MDHVGLIQELHRRELPDGGWSFSGSSQMSLETTCLASFSVLAEQPLQLRTLFGHAERLLADGDRLAWLKNWQAAEPFFEKAEILFRERGDKRNELYARISR